MPACHVPDFDKRLGANIRYARIAAKMSQTALGDALGITFQQLQKYEKGLNRVSAGALVRIAGLVGKSVTDLLDLDSVATPATAAAAREGARIAEAFARIADPGVRRRTLALVETLARGDDEAQPAAAPAEPARAAA